MGYDSDECIICYCTQYSNNSTNIIRINLCSTCFFRICKNGLCGRAAYKNCIYLERDSCDCCNKENVLCLSRIAICKNCTSSLQKICNIKILSKNNDNILRCNCNCEYCWRKFTNDIEQFISHKK